MPPTDTSESITQPSIGPLPFGDFAAHICLVFQYIYFSKIFSMSIFIFQTNGNVYRCTNNLIGMSIAMLEDTSLTTIEDKNNKQRKITKNKHIKKIHICASYSNYWLQNVIGLHMGMYSYIFLLIVSPRLTIHLDLSCLSVLFPRHMFVYTNYRSSSRVGSNGRLLLKTLILPNFLLGLPSYTCLLYTSRCV